MKKCMYCGEELADNDKKCKHCGKQLTGVVKNSINPSDKEGHSWVITLLLIMFLGHFGGHRFYVGKTGTAVTMLLMTLLFGLFFTKGILLVEIWILVDFIYILIGKFTDKNGILLVKKPTKISTALICLFFGIAGYHRFYTGKIGVGFVQMFTLGGLLIWWLIDFITIIIGIYKDSNGKLLPDD